MQEFAESCPYFSRFQGSSSTLQSADFPLAARVTWKQLSSTSSLQSHEPESHPGGYVESTGPGVRLHSLNISFKYCSSQIDFELVTVFNTDFKH